MKVILGSESFPPNVSGVATATKNLAENLKKSGHEPFVFTPGNVYRAHKDDRFDYPVIRLRSIKNPFRPGYRITFAPKRELLKRIKEINPDIIHLQDPASIGQALCEVGRELGIPVVVTNHFSLEYALSYVKFAGLALPILKKGLIAYLASFYNKCDQVVTPTETFRRQVESWGVKTPVCAISNGIEIEPFLEKFSGKQIAEVRVKYHLPDNPTILYLGRIDKDKSIDVLIRAIPEVVKVTNAHFVIAGQGDQTDEIKSLAKELGVENDVTFLGFIDHKSDDFVRIYKSSTVFAIPSTIETQSIVTLEALSSGLPVVAADAGALPELVHDNKNGFLFPPGNDRKLASDIIQILKNNNKRKEMGENSVQIALHHQMNLAFGEMLEMYKEVIKRKKQT